MPAADFCRTVRVNCSTLSPDSGTCGRPPELSSTAFNAQPPNLQPAPLMDMDFAIIRPLVQRSMPHIRFLSIGSRLCSTLLSDPASRRCPGASLSLLLHKDGKGTCTPKLLNMLGTRTEGPKRPFTNLQNPHQHSQNTRFERKSARSKQKSQRTAHHIGDFQQAPRTCLETTAAGTDWKRRRACGEPPVRGPAP